MWIFVFCVFLKVMKKKYRKGFFSLERGCDYSKNFFLKGEGDHIKQKLFGDNQNMWKSIRPQVQDWLSNNWWRWEEENPEW